MSTGLESWNVDLLSVGPVYPFAGSELVLTVVGVICWIAWHIFQARVEAREIHEEQANFSDPEALADAMDYTD